MSAIQRITEVGVVADKKLEYVSEINNFDLEPEDFDPFRVNTSQFFLKFQYLIGI